jgi:hypothetical protein
MQCRGPGPVHGHGKKAGGIDSAGDADKVYILLTAKISGSILHWEEKGRFSGNGGIVDARAGQVIVQNDDKVPEIEPPESKRPRQLCIMPLTTVPQFSWEPCLKNEACIDRESFKHTLGYLRSMCALKNRHTWLDLGVNGVQKSSNLDGNEVLGDKQHFMHLNGSGRGGHSEFFG